MGRDLTLYPSKASRQDLKMYIEGLGFSRCGHFWDWPKGTLNYSWFDPVDFRSIDGVSADIYPVEGEELSITGNAWALHVRNLYSASWYDVNMLNEVLRGARKQFGGKILGDYGTNRYAPLWNDESTPISRGISSVYQEVDQKLSAVKYALPDPEIDQPMTTDPLVAEFITFTNTFDPSRVIYNGLVPFAVSMFEYFFSRTFQILIAYDSGALEKRSNYQSKVDFEDLREVATGNLTIEEVIASKYSFQNLNQINKAYKDWLGIDVRKILYRKRKIGNSINYLENRISQVIEYRHGVVHKFQIDRSLTKERFLEVLAAVEKAIEEFIEYLQKLYSFKIDRP